MASQPRSSRRTVILLAWALVLASASAAVYLVREALEERQVVAAAVDLRFVALTVVSTEALGLEGDLMLVPVAGLEESLDYLDQSHDLALHGLSGTERAEVESNLAELVETGRLLLARIEAAQTGALVEPVLGVDDAGAVTPASPVDELTGNETGRTLLDVLGRAADDATSDAHRAEQGATVALAVAVLVAALAVWLTLRLYYQQLRDRAVANVQARAGERLERLLNDSPDVFVLIDKSDQITYRSSSASRLFPAEITTGAELVALANDGPTRHALAIHLDSAVPGRRSELFELTDVNGSCGWYEVQVSDLTDDDLVDGHLVTIRDVTRQEQLRRDLSRQARTDLLTGLANRRALDPLLSETEQIARAEGGTVALISLDLDGFKAINDTLGHQAGDDLLVQVTARLREVTRSSDTLVRLGGDEFAVVLPRLNSAEEAYLVAERYLTVLDAPFNIDHHLEHLRISIGVAATEDPSHVPSLVSEADVAMYHAKRSGGGQVATFEPSMEQTTATTSRITRALRAADFNREFSLVFQPIVDIDGTRIVSLETLLRWDSPTLGSIGPNDFIPVAERSGDICNIGAWVFENVCRQVSEWERVGLDPDLSVSVNVSPRQLATDDCVPGLLAAIARWGLHTSRFVIEVTESTVIDSNSASIRRLDELRQAGLRIAIDDFGSGYSNLGQLLSVPFDLIKIDRSLLVTLTDMRQAAHGDPTEPCAIMSAIVSIAGIFDAPVVCEGVEVDLQRVSLKASGITYIQGYLTGRPVPPTEIEASLIAGGLLDGAPPRLTGIRGLASAGRRPVPLINGLISLGWVGARPGVDPRFRGRCRRRPPHRGGWHRPRHRWRR